MRPRNLILPALAGLALLTASHAASAWDWSHPVGNGERVDFQPGRAVVDSYGDLWVAGANSNAGVFVHYRPDGTHQATFGVPSIMSYGDALVAGSDGSVVVAGLDYGEKCYAVKASRDGRVAWRQTIPSCTAAQQYPLTLWPADAAGGHWLVSSLSLIRLGSDGRIVTRIAHPQISPGDVTVDLGTGRVYRWLVTGSGTALVAHDAGGTELWRRAADAFGTTRLRSLSVAPDGSLRATGSDGNNAVVMALEATGSVRWRSTVAGFADPDLHPRAPLVASDGAAWFYLDSFASSQDTPVAVRVTATGQQTGLLRAGGFSPDDSFRSADDVAVAPNGDLVVTKATTAFRFSTTGERRVHAMLATQIPQLERLVIEHLDNDGSMLLIANARQAPTRLVRLAADGAMTILDTPLTEPSRVAATQSVAADGSTLAVASAIDGTSQVLRIDAGGRPAWQRALLRAPMLPGIYEGLQNASVAERAGRTCVLGAGEAGSATDWIAGCYDTASGAEIWSRTIGRSDSFLPPRATARLVFEPTGTLVARFNRWEAQSGTNIVTFMRLGATGDLLSTKEWPDAYAAYETTRANAFALILAGSQLVVTGPDGTERYRITPPAKATFTDYAFADDGGLVIAWREGDPFASTTVVRRHGANGAELWRKTVGGMSEAERVAVGRDAVFVSGCCHAPVAPELRRRSIVALSLADGSERWRNERLRDDYANLYIATTASGSHLVVTSGVPSRNPVVVRLLDVADGQELLQKRLPCPGALCTLREAPIVAGGRLHAVLQSEAGGTLVAAWTIPTAPAARIRLDQPGIAGAWWSPYANGEGFVLDYLPDSRTLFMPWFTFSREGGNDPAGQRWYVVQGAVPANATSVELPITESIGGAFDAGPTVAPTIVGTATLSFTDCDNGTLRYRFDEGRNGGATGTITLTRLSPATQSCVLADGTTQTRNSTPANGFDARMSGSWFEPATSGQGLQLTVQPGGIFFAPWFTYDPADASDDPGKQHWFTVQGSLANARNGVAELPIVQTIGGAFDSVPTSNMVAVGKATITMLACDRARLDYRFDDTELAAPLRARSGSIDLVKAGGCAAP